MKKNATHIINKANTLKLLKLICVESNSEFEAIEISVVSINAKAIHFKPSIIACNQDNLL